MASSSSFGADAGGAEAERADALRQRFLYFCKVGRVLTDIELRECAQLAEALKEVLLEDAKRLLSSSSGQPVLFSYQSDATSLLCTAQQQAALGSSAQVVIRRGKVLHELLMQRGFLKMRTPSGQDRVAILMRDPLPLTAGKSVWHLFSAAVGFFPLLRKAGAAGICIQHLAADRAVFGALDRRLRQRQEAFYTEGLGPDHGKAAKLLKLTDWCVSTGCSAHDMHNGLKWAIAAAASAEDLKSLHIAIESLRNSFALLTAELPAFLMQHIAWSDAPRDEDRIQEFWQALGVHVDHLEHVVYVNPLWREGRLCVNAAVAEEVDPIGAVSSALLCICAWRKFTDSRWATVGVACRALVASLCAGLVPWVAQARRNPKNTDYHLHGFQFLTASVKISACVAALASYPAEGGLLEVLADDRLAKRLEVVEGSMLEDIAYVEGLGQHTWATLAEMLGDASGHVALRSQVVTSMHISGGYIKSKVFQVVRSLPWGLAIGDVDANLAALERSDDPITDMCADKIRTLLRAGPSVKPECQPMLPPHNWGPLFRSESLRSPASRVALRLAFELTRIQPPVVAGCGAVAQGSALDFGASRASSWQLRRHSQSSPDVLRRGPCDAGDGPPSPAPLRRRPGRARLEEALGSRRCVGQEAAAESRRSASLPARLGSGHPPGAGAGREDVGGDAEEHHAQAHRALQGLAAGSARQLRDRSCEVRPRAPARD